MAHDTVGVWSCNGMKVEISVDDDDPWLIDLIVTDKAGGRADLCWLTPDDVESLQRFLENTFGRPA
jgi:hypothetical protein